MNRKLRIGLSACLLALFLFSTAKMVNHWQEEKQNEESNLAAQTLMQETVPAVPTKMVAEETQPPETEVTEATEPPIVWIPEPVEGDANMETLAKKDLSALREENPDVIGWIWIPETLINYPIMQGEDNTYYLEHTWDHRANAHGSIFLEHLNSPDLTDFNTIIYGHNMQNGSMFARLHRFKQEYYWKAHPYVYIATGEGVLRYEIFSSYGAEVDSITYQLSFQQTQTREAFIQHALENSDIQTGIQPETTDRIITMSTCTGMGYGSRRVVHARLKMIEAQ